MTDKHAPVNVYLPFRLLCSYFYNNNNETKLNPIFVGDDEDDK